MKKRFEYKDDVSNKFWEISLKNKEVQVTFGRMGIQSPQSIKKKFSTNEKKLTLLTVLFIIFPFY